MTVETAPVEYSRDGAIARIHLNRPERLNAVTTALTDGLAEALERATSEDARVIVLAGRGRAFCAGHDLKEPEPVETPVQTRVRLEGIQEITRLIRRFPGPVVAAVHGYALGAGCEFALACDVVVAGEDAQLGFPEVGVGLSVTGGISRLLPMLVGWARAKELLLLGERVSGLEAARIGLVARAVPSGAARAGRSRARTAPGRAPGPGPQPRQAGARPRSRRHCRRGDGAGGRPCDPHLALRRGCRAQGGVHACLSPRS